MTIFSHEKYPSLWAWIQFLFIFVDLYDLVSYAICFERYIKTYYYYFIFLFLFIFGPNLCINFKNTSGFFLTLNIFFKITIFDDYFIARMITLFCWEFKFFWNPDTCNSFVTSIILQIFNLI